MELCRSKFLIVILWGMISYLCSAEERRNGSRGIRSESRLGVTQESSSLREDSSVCTISTTELTETVEVIASSVLEGVCNPSRMEARFDKLESLLTKQLSELKESLTILEERMVDQWEESAKCVEAASGNSGSRLTTKSGGGSRSLVGSEVSVRSGTSRSNSSSSRRRLPLESISAPVSVAGGHLERGGSEGGVGESGERSGVERGGSESVSEGRQAVGENVESVGYGVRSEDRDRIYDQQFYASEADVFSYTEAGGGRAEEIRKYNNTVYTEDGKRVFSYYWVITEMTEKLKHWTLRANVRSSKFYVHPSGYRLYMKIIPRYDDNSTYLNVGLTKGEYDQVLHWPFNHPMRLSILAHGKGSSYDLKSRMWNPWELCSGSNWKKPSGDNTVCVGLGFPHNVIQQPLYLWNDCLTVKLNVYVD